MYKEKVYPNGLALVMYQDDWNIIKDDWLNVFSKFHNNRVINKNFIKTESTII